MRAEVGEGNVSARILIRTGRASSPQLARTFNLGRGQFRSKPTESITLLFGVLEIHTRMVSRATPSPCGRQ
jgi:hypothetical protein